MWDVCYIIPVLQEQQPDTGLPKAANTSNTALSCSASLSFADTAAASFHVAGLDLRRCE